MTMTAERRNERDRAKHSSATKVTLYELGILIAVLNATDKGFEIWLKGIPWPGVLGIVCIAGVGIAGAGFMFDKRREHLRLFNSLDDELAKDAEQLATAGADGSA